MNDYAELERKLLDEVSISKTSLRTEMEDMYTEEDADNYQTDASIEETWKKYKNLAKWFGDKVVICDESGECVRLEDACKSRQEYRLCLSMMGSSEISYKLQRKMSALFEEITAVAVRAYLGPGSESKCIDQNPPIDIQKFCKEELLEIPHEDISNAFHKGNPRCDVVGWKKIDDRGGKVIILAQCKSGKNWRDGHPVNIGFWKERLVKFCSEPIKAFAVSDLVDADEFLILTPEKGLLFDRARIVALLARVDDPEIREARDRIRVVLERGGARVV